VFTVGLVVTTAAAMAQQQPSGDGIWLLLNSVFQGTACPTITTLAVRGLAKGDIKTASIWLVSSQLGAAAIPCIFHAVRMAHGPVHAFCVSSRRSRPCSLCPSCSPPAE